MSRNWLQQKERGSEFLLRFIGWLCLHVGWRVGRALLYPICAYFVVFSGVARTASRQYLTIVLRRPPRLRDVYHHYHTFAATILDRVFFLTNQFRDYEIAVHGLDVVYAQVESKKGCILLGAHLGSFEVMQTMGVLHEGLPIKALMYPGNSPQINAVRAKLNPALAADFIPLGSPTAMFQVKEHLEKGGLIGILGDRITHGERKVRSQFLGKPAFLPEGPLLLASLLQVPVVLMFGLYSGARKYDIHFELFASSVSVKRQTRQADIKAWVDQYVARIEHYCRIAPFNWFNFYDFWERENDDS